MFERYIVQRDLRKIKRPIFRAVADALSRPRSRMAIVNVGKLSRLGKDGSIILVPGKVLGSGKVDKKIIVGALSYSKQAKEKIVKAGGEALSLTEFARRFSKNKEEIIFVGG